MAASAAAAGHRPAHSCWVMRPRAGVKPRSLSAASRLCRLCLAPGMILVWVHPPEPASCLHHYSVKNPTAVQPYKVRPQLRATARSHRQEAAPAAESLRSASLLIGGRRRTTCTHLPRMATFGRGLVRRFKPALKPSHKGGPPQTVVRGGTCVNRRG
jgi:hypothetical protein